MKKFIVKCLCIALMAICNVCNIFSQTPPNNEIWYTSTDGKVITPNNLDMLSMVGDMVVTDETPFFQEFSIISNYYEGKGVIRFNGPLKGIWYGAFENCTTLSSITIPNSVTSIGARAFSGCSSLASITIPNSVTSIGSSAFSGCSNLTSINIPNSVTSIEYYAFEGCTSLSAVHITSLESWCKIKFGDFDANPLGKAHRLFLNNVELKEIVIPSTITTINDCAFLYSSLTSITIPNSVKSIGEYALAWCKSLTSINIPNSVTSIGQSAFWNCTSLTSITIPNSVTSIESCTFEGCSSLTSITIPNSVTSIEYEAFDGCSSLASITIPNSVKSIGKYAFYGCKFIASITIPNSVTSIGDWAFYGCKFTKNEFVNSCSLDAEANGYWGATICDVIQADGLCIKNNVAVSYRGNPTSITIPNSVTSIEYEAFDGCSSLASITIPNSVTSIGDWAFSGCKFTKNEFVNSCSLDAEANGYWGATICDVIQADGLCIKNNVAVSYRGNPTSITIPNSVTSIGDRAFSGCKSLTSITIPNSVTSIENDAFFDCSSLASIKVDDGNSIYDSRDNCNAIISKSDNTLILGCKNTIIPNSVTSIRYFAFYKCSNLTSITIPNSVKSIGDEAFYGCSSLTEVYCYAENVPSTGWSSFTYVPLSTATLYVPTKSIDSYKATSPWSEFGTITNIPEPNVFVTDLHDNTSEIEVKANDTFSLSDSIKSLKITATIPDVNLTYTRNFSDAMVNNWQAWYMPCDFDYDDLSEDFDVAQIAGVLLDGDGNSYIAFKKMTEGTVLAHTPYVIRAKEAGDVTITATTTLRPTEGATNFYLLSAFNKFTFGGVYENSYLSAEYPTYALNKSGNFTLMGESVYLRPFRIYMRITDREDNPYKTAVTPAEVKVVVLGEDDTTGLTDLSNSSNLSNSSQPIFNLGGQKLQKLQKGINIVNGKKVLY